MEAYVAGLEPAGTADLPPCYAGYFTCFNRGDYYEAHDVLEHLWLQDRNGPDGAFYKGLIQFAGGFVHLRLQHFHPAHAKHGRRLAPAARLFALAAGNLAPYGPRHQRLDVDALVALAHATAQRLQAGEFRVNPWSPSDRPRIDLTPA